MDGAWMRPSNLRIDWGTRLITKSLIAGGDGELARAAASAANLQRRPAGLLAHERDAIGVERRECERPPVIRCVLIVQMDAAQPGAPSEQVRSMSYGGHVLNFDAILI